MPVLYSVAEPNGVYLAILAAGPSDHGVGVGIVEERDAAGSATSLCLCRTPALLEYLSEHT